MKFFYSFKVFVENLLCNEDGSNIIKDYIEVIVNWDFKVEFSIEI